MKNKKIYIGISIIVILLLISIGVLYNNRKNLTTKSKNIIGELDITKKSYGYPLITLVYSNDTDLTVDAGIYRFGDIDQDGIIGNNDIDALETMISTDKIGFTKGQTELADVNEDGNVDNQDIELFQKYLAENGEVQYDTNKKLLNYCITDVNDSSNCIWQESENVKIKSQKDYYIFVKQINNDRISDVYKVSKDIFEKPKI